MKYCSAKSHMINGGEFRCERAEGHKGIHMAESGDSMDFGLHGDWEIVDSIVTALEQAYRRIGVNAVRQDAECISCGKQDAYEGRCFPCRAVQ